MIKKTLWLCVVAYVFGLLWVSFFQNSVPQINRLRRQRDAWARKVKQRSADNLALARQINGLETDFRYTEKRVREDLLLHKKDELVILVPDEWER